MLCDRCCNQERRHASGEHSVCVSVVCTFQTSHSTNLCRQNEHVQAVGGAFARAGSALSRSVKNAIRGNNNTQDTPAAVHTFGDGDDTVSNPHASEEPATPPKAE